VHQPTKPEKLSDTTYRISNAHLNKQYPLLPPRQRAQIDSGEPTDRHGADTVEQRIDVGYPISAIAGIEYPRKDQGGENAG